MVRAGAHTLNAIPTDPPPRSMGLRAVFTSTMRQDSTPPDGSVVLSTAAPVPPVAAVAGPASSDGVTVLPRVAPLPHLSWRLILGCVIALHVILLLSAPLQLNDVFNYLGYARLGAVHHVNPYAHGIGTALHDPAYRFSSWHHLRSPYGPLFTAF